MNAFVHDLRVAIRGLARGGSLPWVAVACLAVGIGLNTGIFTIVHGVLYRELPFRDPDAVVAVVSASEARGVDEAGVTFADVEELRATGAFARVEAIQERSFTLTGGDVAEQVQGSGVTPGLFPLLGVEPALGRSFLPGEGAEAGFEQVVLLSDRVWQRSFGGDPDVLGRSLELNGRQLSVVGVMPPGFRFPETDDLWVPLAPTDPGDRSRRAIAVVARLADGVPLDAARERAEDLSARMAGLFPETHRDWTLQVQPIRETAVNPPTRRVMELLLGAVAFVLLIACGNVANLLLARGSEREQEVAVRAALGASRARVVRQLLTEALVLALAGAAGGSLLALWMVDATLSRIPEDLAYWMRFDLDGAVLLYTLALSVLTALLFGTLPALRASRADVAHAMGGRGSVGGRGGRLRAGLVAGEIALSLVLLVGAGLMVRSFLSLNAADAGFPTDRVLSVRLLLAGDRYDPATAKADFFQTAAERIAGLPDVDAAVWMSAIPADDGGWALPVRADRETAVEDAPVAIVVGSTAGTFEALGVGLGAGREITPSEARDTAARVAVVGATLARRLWGGADPVGRTLLVDEDVELTVVGLAPDLQYEEFGEQSQVSLLQVHVPASLFPWRGMALLARTPGDPAAATAAVRRELAALDPALATYDVLTMEERRRYTTWPQRFFGLLFAQFGVVALLLALAGVYGVMAYAVSVRRREIGVRIVLGASGRSVMGEMMRRSLVPAAVGTVVGLAGALAVTRLLSGLLYGVAETDVPTYLGAAGAMVAAAVLATWLPARRILRLRPAEALRSE